MHTICFVLKIFLAASHWIYQRITFRFNFIIIIIFVSIKIKKIIPNHALYYITVLLLQFPNRKWNQTRTSQLLEARTWRTRSGFPRSSGICCPRRPDHPNRIHRRWKWLPAIRISPSYTTTNPSWNPRIAQTSRHSAQHSRTHLPIGYWIRSLLQPLSATRLKWFPSSNYSFVNIILVPFSCP